MLRWGQREVRSFRSSHYKKAPTPIKRDRNENARLWDGLELACARKKGRDHFDHAQSNFKRRERARIDNGGGLKQYHVRPLGCREKDNLARF